MPKQPPRDHQLFEKTVLPNGITLYTYRDAFPISCVEVVLPVGSGHAVAANGFLPGSPHFLEHTQLIRSNLYPQPYSLDRLLGLRAGHTNASTHAAHTSHWIDTPTSEHRFAAEALVDRVFRPILAEEDLAVERGVVINERNQKKFYPGKSKSSQYYYSKFLDDVLFPLEQIFGSDEDLARMDVEALGAMHGRVVSSRDTVALAVGDSDFAHYAELLAAIPTDTTTLETSIRPVGWTNREFHVVYLDTVPQPRLEVAWVHPRMSYEDFRGACFLISLLINSTQGPLHVEYREEKGWTYGLDGSCALRHEGTVCGMTFPVNSMEQVEHIRDSLGEDIRAAVADQGLVEREIRRQLGNQVYAFQTAGSIISSASSDLITFGTIYTEDDLDRAVRRMADPAVRTDLLERFFRPEEMGSVCFMPERRKMVYARE